ncbi:mRNA decapping protein 2 Box A domain [Arabidopsis suecica]|uniref:mRNA decapping protein 2 Box A domain n=1 Tax=Arabidopsis suecica TaxID=45249 RepID=A0A8T2AJ38_ARASU|nr:mRNA decapping protein 2 Box A domain [Arabidopsis suecica]
MSDFYGSSSYLESIGYCLPSNETLDALLRQFLPEESRRDKLMRVMFRVEKAYWQYCEDLLNKDLGLMALGFTDFIPLLLNRCDRLRRHAKNPVETVRLFTSHKRQLPVSGAIILDEEFEKVLLVKGFKGPSWTFPRGKKDYEDKEDYICAIREVLEETGFDISNLLDKKHCLQKFFDKQRACLYIVAGVSTNTTFAPQTKREIEAIKWHRLDSIQPAIDEFQWDHVVGDVRFFRVAPFLPELNTWISEHRPPVAQSGDMSVTSLGDTLGRFTVD